MTFFQLVCSVLVLLFMLGFVGMMTFEKFDRAGKIIPAILAPIFFFITTLIYLIILVKLFDFSFDDIEKVHAYSLLGFFGFGILLFFGAISPKHATKSGRADKRYKDNGPQNDEAATIVILVLISSGVGIFLLGKFTSITIIGLVRAIFG